MSDLDCLVIGDTVQLKKDKKGYTAKATIEFIGEVKDKEGIFYGVSVDRAWKGKHNGTFKNIKYFETDQQRGLFITHDRISKFIERVKTKNKSEDKRITINDSVNIPKLECDGIVRFIGCVNHKPGIFYGVTLNIAKGKNNGTIKGRTYFKCDQNYGIFLKLKEIEKNNGNGGGLPGLPPMHQDDGNELAIVHGGGGMPPPPPGGPGGPGGGMPPPPPQDSQPMIIPGGGPGGPGGGMPPPPPQDSQPQKPKKKKGAAKKKVNNQPAKKQPVKKKAANNNNKKKKPAGGGAGGGAAGKKKKVVASGAPPSFEKPKPKQKAKAKPKPKPAPLENIGPGMVDYGPGGGPLPGSPEAGGNDDKEEDYDYKMEPGYTDPGSVQPKPASPHQIQQVGIPQHNFNNNNNYNNNVGVGPFSQMNNNQMMNNQMNNNQMMNNLMVNDMNVYKQTSGPGGGGEGGGPGAGPGMPGGMNPMQQYQNMQQMMFNQFNNPQQQQMLQQQFNDLINNPAAAAQKYAANPLDNLEIKEEKKEVIKPKFGMFGDEYFNIEGILRIIGCDDEACKFYINRMKANNINDTNLIHWDTTGNMAMFKKIFPIEEDIRMRFRSWVRYDIQGYIPAFKSEGNSKNLSAKLTRKKSIFAKKKEQMQEDEDIIIGLNICGVKYNTLRSTLLNSGSSFFKKLMKKKYIGNDEKKKKKGKDKDHLSFDKDGNYFIDGRNGNLFEPILNYMQSGKLIINYSKYSLDEIKNEFKFYDISFPKDSGKLPADFRFEYVCGEYYFNLEKQQYDFMVCKFRIHGPNKKKWTTNK